MVVVGRMLGQFFPVHVSYKKEDLDKFIILFYSKERESIIIWV